jgi:hypothetical protein
MARLQQRRAFCKFDGSPYEVAFWFGATALVGKKPGMGVDVLGLRRVEYLPEYIMSLRIDITTLIHSIAD